MLANILFHLRDTFRSIQKSRSCLYACCYMFHSSMLRDYILCTQYSYENIMIMCIFKRVAMQLTNAIA